MESVIEEFEEGRKFLSLLAETNGFDIEDLMHSKPPPPCLVINLRNEGNYRTEVLLNAKMGIHKYKGKNLKFSHIEKYVEERNPTRADYYMTLVAKDGDSLVPFQTNVVEEHFDKSLLVYIARLKDPESGEPESSSVHYVDSRHQKFAKLPQWPSSDKDAFIDTNQYYLVKKSELSEYDWIRMYTELAFLRANLKACLKIKNPILSRVAILKVAVESEDNVDLPNERLKAVNATFYIKYKYRHQKPPAGQVLFPEPPLYGTAVVRRTMHKGCFTVMFDTCFL